MFGRKKKTNRLYYPTKSRWMTRKRRKPTVKISRKKKTVNYEKLIKEFFKNSFYLLILGIIGVIVAIFFVFSSYFAIKEIEVARDNFKIDTSSIENKLNKYIGENIIFFSRAKIIQSIKEEFPEFVSVKVNKSLPNKLKIHLENYEIIANLRAYHLPPKKEEPQQDFTELERAVRGDSKPHPLEDEEIVRRVFDLDLVEAQKKEEEESRQEIEQKCGINQTGQAIFDQEENLELITIIIRGLEQPVEDRGRVLTEDEMNYIMDAMHYFNNLFHMQVRGIKYFSIERELHFTLDTGMVIWLTTTKEYKQQIDKLNIIYEEAELNKEDLVYIDLRVKEKVIYCPKKSRCAR